MTRGQFDELRVNVEWAQYWLRKAHISLLQAEESVNESFIDRWEMEPTVKDRRRPGQKRQGPVRKPNTRRQNPEPSLAKR